jgi:hypothetical protein
MSQENVELVRPRLFTELWEGNPISPDSALPSLGAHPAGRG